MSTKMLLLNGPAMTGKDELFNYLERHIPGTSRCECKKQLHELTMKFFHVPPEEYWAVYNDRNRKELPHPYFIVSDEAISKLKRHIKGFKDRPHPCLSIREALIYVSECVVKSSFGVNWFGVARAEEVKRSIDSPKPGHSLLVDASVAFEEEIHSLYKYMKDEDILLLRIYRDGCTFEGDSRDYLPEDLVENTIDIDGNKPLDAYLHSTYTKIKDWLNT